MFCNLDCYFHTNSLKSKIQFIGRHESEGKASGERLDGSFHSSTALDLVVLELRHIITA